MILHYIWPWSVDPEEELHGRPYGDVGFVCKHPPTSSYSLCPKIVDNDRIAVIQLADQGKILLNIILFNYWCVFAVFQWKTRTVCSICGDTWSASECKWWNLSFLYCVVWIKLFNQISWIPCKLVIPSCFILWNPTNHIC